MAIFVTCELGRGVLPLPTPRVGANPPVKLFKNVTLDLFTIYFKNGRLSWEVKILKKIYKGIVEGNVIHLEEKITLPIGTKALIILKPMDKEEQEKIKERQLKFLDKGFYLGKKEYSNREDLYAG
ncbi:MAG: hypothetical protein HZA13_06585 [Nitrospirae bacterium]|nr:hypothetical protein [Nitrospirota bacterium]